MEMYKVQVAESSTAQQQQQQQQYQQQQPQQLLQQQSQQQQHVGGAVTELASHNLETLIYCTLSKEKDGVKREMYVLRNESFEDFISRYMSSLDTANGVFSKRAKLTTTVQFRCERSHRTKSAGKSTDPAVTHINGCNAYISFNYKDFQGLDIVIVRKYFIHNGHDLNDPEQKRSNPVHKELVTYIQQLCKQNHPVSRILVLAHAWSRKRSATDYTDRRYYVTADDVILISKSARKLQQLQQQQQQQSTKKSTSTSKPQTADITVVECAERESILLYESIDTSLCVVYQSARQRERVANMTDDVIYMGLLCSNLGKYSLDVYYLLVKDVYNQNTPAAFFITINPNADILTKCLAAMKANLDAHSITFQPRIVVTSRLSPLISAIETEFPNTTIRLCWFEVLEEVEHWLEVNESMFGYDPQSAKKFLLDWFRKVKKAATYNDYLQALNLNPGNLPYFPTFADYVRSVWSPLSALWCNYSRHGFTDNIDANTSLRRFKTFITKSWLKGDDIQDQEDMLTLLDEQITAYYDYQDDLRKAGRIKPNTSASKRKRKSKQQHVTASTTLHADDNVVVSLDESHVGVSHVDDASGAVRTTGTVTTTGEEVSLTGEEIYVKFIDEDRLIMEVSERVRSEVHTVDLLKALCTCMRPDAKEPCTHYYVCHTAVESSGMSLSEIRSRRAQHIYEQCLYKVEDGDIHIEIDQDTMSIVSGDRCNCMAAGYGLECVCREVASLVRTNVLAATATSASNNTNSIAVGSTAGTVTSTVIADANWTATVSHAEVANVTHPEVVNVTPPEVVNVTHTEVANVTHPEVVNVTHPEVVNVTHSEVVNMTHTEVANVTHPEVVNVTHAEVANMAHAEVANVTHAEMANVIHPEATNVTHTEVANVTHTEVANAADASSEDTSITTAANSGGVQTKLSREAERAIKEMRELEQIIRTGNYAPALLTKITQAHMFAVVHQHKMHMQQKRQERVVKRMRME